MCYEDNPITLKGIDADVIQPTRTICYTHLQILPNLNHTFHVVPDNFPIPFDGLLGNDVLKGYNCLIDYENNLINIKTHAIRLKHIKNEINSISAPSNSNHNQGLLTPKNNTNVTPDSQTSDRNQIKNEVNSTSKSSKSNHSQGPLTPNSITNSILDSHVANQNQKHIDELIIKPRSETIVKIEIINSNITEGICPKYEILPGVFLCPSIVRVDRNNQALTSVLNTTEQIVKIKLVQINLDSLADHENSTNIRSFQKTNTLPKNYHSERLNKIRNLLRVSHLNEEEKSALINLCSEFNHIFYLEGDQLTYTDICSHEIPVSSSAPLHTKSYRYPIIHKEEVNKQISGMLEQNIIRPSSSPWNSPVWVVPKKPGLNGEKRWRIVIDYRKLNEATIGDSYPLPNITEILDQLGHSSYFTTIDLASGFHQIKMSAADAPKTAFSTPEGHYEFIRMPFGLKNAPSTFQRAIDNVLIGLKNNRCFVYLDDIVIHADNLQNHIKNLKQIFQRLSDYNLKIQPDKCEFFRKEVMYLGHLITSHGVKPDPKKITAVENYPIPKTQKDIKAFLGLAGYYRRFIENFSRISQPLTKLLKKNVNFNWTSLQQNSFETLKTLLTNEPVLQYPDFNKLFILTTDASNFAIGSILSQGIIPNDLPVAYASRTLNRAEGNYSTTEKELLAIVWSVKHFRPYLYGQKFKIITDHRPLTWLFNVKDPGSRLIRWRLALEEYDYEIIYKQGKHNQNADALSRITLETPEVEQSTINQFSSRRITETYTDFLQKSQSTLIINNNLEEVGTNLINANEHIVLFISTDLEISDTLRESLEPKFNHNGILKQENPQLNDIIKINFETKTIYYCFVKTHFWNSISYEELFNILVKLKNLLITDNITNICLPRLGTYHDNLRWNKIRIILRYIFKNTSIHIKICHNSLIEPAHSEIPVILKEYHCNPSSGHTGFHRTYNRIKQFYKWNKMKLDIKNFIKQCDSCQKNKLVRKKIRKPMEITTTSSIPFEKIFLDVVGPLPLTENGNKFIITLQDDLTKYSLALPVPNHEAKTIADFLVTRFICTYGIPQSLVSDQGKDFMSNLLNETAKLFKITKINCTAYHPQSNGALERSHSTLANYLKHYINTDQTDWDCWMPFAMFSYNTTTHTSTKFSPYELVFGHKPNLPTSITSKPEFKYSYDNYIDELTLRLRKSHEVAKTELLKSKEQNKSYYDKRVRDEIFNVGEFVYLLNETSKPGTSKKLTPSYTGPHKIISLDSLVNCTILVKNKRVKVHLNRLKKAFVADA